MWPILQQIGIGIIGMLLFRMMAETLAISTKASLYFSWSIQANFRVQINSTVTASFKILFHVITYQSFYYLMLSNLSY